jgi:hypothetical protein
VPEEQEDDEVGGTIANDEIDKDEMNVRFRRLFPRNMKMQSMW